MNRTIIIVLVVGMLTTFGIWGIMSVEITSQKSTLLNQIDSQLFLIEELNEKLETEKSKNQEMREVLNITINEYNELSNGIHKWENGLLDKPPTSIPNTETLDQEFTVKLIRSLDGNQITIEGTVPKTHYGISGTISSGDLEKLSIIYAFTLKSDENGFYKKVIEIDREDSKWQQENYTLFMKSGNEYKQLKFTL